MEFGTYSQNNLRFIEVSKLHKNLGDTLRRALPGYHAFMGCDYIAAFCRKGESSTIQDTGKYLEISRGI